MSDLLSSLGATGWLLLFCFVAVIVLILERSTFYWGLGQPHLVSGDSPSELIRSGSLGRLRDQIYGRTGLLEKGVEMLLEAQQNDRCLRLDALSLWLEKQQQYLSVHLEWLKLLAIVSPVLGLLGAVSGLSHAFRALKMQDVALHMDPLASTFLTNVLEQGLLSTALGLLTAILAIAFLYAFRYWVNRYINGLKSILSEMNLEMSGMKRAGNSFLTPVPDYANQAWV